MAGYKDLDFDSYLKKIGVHHKMFYVKIGFEYYLYVKHYMHICKKDTVYLPFIFKDRNIKPFEVK